MPNYEKAYIYHDCFFAGYLQLKAIDQNRTPILLDAVTVSMTAQTTNTYSLGEPVRIKIVINNNSDHLVSLFTPSLERYKFRTLDLFLLAPHKTNFTRIDWPNVYLGSLKIISPPSMVDLTLIQPKEQIEFKYNLDYDFSSISHHRWLFPCVGDYEVKAEVRFMEKTAPDLNRVSVDAPAVVVETKPLRITILPPDKPSDIQVFEALRQLKYDYLLYAPEQFDPERHHNAVNEIQSFISRYPQSRYDVLGTNFLNAALEKTASR